MNTQQRRSIVSVSAMGVAAALMLVGCSGGATEVAPTNGNGEIEFTVTGANLFEDVEAVESIHDLLPDDVKAAGKITNALNLTTPPTKFYAEDGKTPIGTNPDISRLLARVLGIEIEIVNVEFDGIIPGLQSEQFDISIASIGVTPERSEVLDMVEYAQWGSSAVAAKGSGIDVSALCGLDVGVQQGSLQQATILPSLSEACETKGGNPIKIVSLPSQQDALTQLSSGRLDAAFGDTPNMAYAVLQRAEFELAGQDIEARPITLAAKDGSDLTPALLAAMRHVITLPQYATLFNEWGLPDAALTSVNVH